MYAVAYCRFVLFHLINAHHNLFVYSEGNGHFVFVFLAWSIINEAAANILVCSFFKIFCTYICTAVSDIPRRSARLWKKHMFSLINTNKMSSENGYTDIFYNQQCMNILIAPDSDQHLILQGLVILSCFIFVFIFNLSIWWMGRYVSISWLYFAFL